MCSAHHDIQRLLHLYYANLFPYDLIFTWLNPGGSKAAPPTHREIGVFMKREDGRDFVRRWLCFKDPDTLRIRVIDNKPIAHKFDIGAVYTKPISDRDNIVLGDIPFYSIAREFVLDIDMDEYDEIRTCCEGKVVCSKCWQFIAAAAQLLDTTLREDAGFNEITWVFSGRRGIHCWVTDQRAKRMNAETRIGLAQYLVLLSREAKFSQFRFEGRYERRAVNILSKFWPRILKDQNIFFDEKKGEKIRQRIYDQINTSCPGLEVHEMLKDLRTSGTCWGKSEALWAETEKYLRSKSTPQKSFENVCNFVMLTCLQPRLDIGVSKEMSHLLKSPFCVHVDTKKICCPIQIDRIHEFDPNTVPRLGPELIGECKDTAVAAFQASLEPYRQTFLSAIQLQQQDRN